MPKKSVIYSPINPEKIEISEWELEARLGGKCEEGDERISEIICRVRSLAEPKFSALELEVGYSDEKILLGGKAIESVGLKRCLSHAKRAYIIAVTLGARMDRELLLLSKRSPGEHFIFDAVSSAYAEAAMDAAENALLSAVPHTNRFSPGYGDLSLSLQKFILDTLSADKLLGITLTDTSLMIPTKSITAIIGIKD